MNKQSPIIKQLQLECSLFKLSQRCFKLCTGYKQNHKTQDFIYDNIQQSEFEMCIRKCTVDLAQFREMQSIRIQ
ncbi:hypothetical protein pb186bvf_005248 [Paramecium bursaria]